MVPVSAESLGGKFKSHCTKLTHVLTAELCKPEFLLCLAPLKTRCSKVERGKMPGQDVRGKVAVRQGADE